MGWIRLEGSQPLTRPRRPGLGSLGSEKWMSGFRYDSLFTKITDKKLSKNLLCLLCFFTLFSFFAEDDESATSRVASIASLWKRKQTLGFYHKLPIKLETYFYDEILALILAGHEP